MNLRKLTLVCLVVMTLTATSVLALQPFGANITFVNSTRAPEDAPDSWEALAGNVTQINVFGYSPTQSWQGYYGNVSGTVMLADANDNVMYNWSLASPEGEIYASTNGTIDWTNVQCFNFTAAGTFVDDSANRGGTSQFGMNLTQLHEAFNINWDDVDAVNNTFSLAGTHESGAGLAHDLFYTNNLEFSTGECLSTHLFIPNGGTANGTFQQVLQYDPTTQSIIFTSILDEEDVAGFDGQYHDFQMIVLEDGHGTNVDTTTYYFYVELE